MIKSLSIGFISLLILGCASTYGLDAEEWNAMTQQQRHAIEAQAQNRVADALEYQREKEFLNQPIDAVFGSRSNAY